MPYRSLSALLLCFWSVLALADYAAAPRRPIDLTGYWLIDPTTSDDPEAMLAERQEEERRDFEKMRRREMNSQPPGMPPPIDADAPPPGGADRGRPQRPWQKRHEENLRRMLGVSPTLEIKQVTPAKLDVISAVESRRLEAGSHSQVSMPEGELADSNVGWDGEWFVIKRTSRGGPNSIEKFRIVKKTGQLEYYMAWSGDTELRGMKIRRFYKRRVGPPPAANPDSGPHL